MKNIKITKFLKHSLVSKKWPEHLPAFKGKPYQEMCWSNSGKEYA